jgi:alpha 1,2-mannosyltransferase
MLLKSTTIRLAVFMVVFFASFVYLIPKKYEGPVSLLKPDVRITNLTEATSTFNASVVHFWRDLATALLDAQPQCGAIKVANESSRHSGDHVDRLKWKEKTSNRSAGITDQDETALLRAHYAIRKSAQRLAPRLPFVQETYQLQTQRTCPFF